MQMKSSVVLAAVASSLMLAGCATLPAAPEPEPPRSGDVAVRALLDVAATERLQLPENEVFNAPLGETDNVVPDYPEALLARRLPPRVVCLRVSIGTDGAVMGTAPVAQPPQCPSQVGIDPAFAHAAALAAGSWHFDPAFRCVYPDAGSVQPGCTPDSPRVAQAVSLVYRFVFEQHDGRGSVRMSH